MEKCGLCCENKTLQLSHVIPRSILNWFKEYQGKMRNSSSPDKRIQNAFTAHLLCSECEQRIGVYDKYFKETLFTEIYVKPKNTIKYNYNHNLVKFSISILFRALLLMKNEITEQRVLKVIDDILDNWRSFLLSDNPSSIKYKQFIVVINNTHYSDTYPKNINIAINSSLDMDIVDSSFVYVRIMKILIFSVFDNGVENSKKIKALSLNKGFIRKVNLKEIPYGVVSYVASRICGEHDNFCLGISDVQIIKIEKEMVTNKDKYLTSEAFKGKIIDDKSN